jgi:hypothetical protein
MPLPLTILAHVGARWVENIARGSVRSASYIVAIIECALHDHLKVIISLGLIVIDFCLSIICELTCLRIRRGFRMNLRVRKVTGASDMMGVRCLLLLVYGGKVR